MWPCQRQLVWRNKVKCTNQLSISLSTLCSLWMYILTVMVLLNIGLGSTSYGLKGYEDNAQKSETKWIWFSCLKMCHQEWGFSSPSKTFLSKFNQPVAPIPTLSSSPVGQPLNPHMLPRVSFTSDEMGWLSNQWFSHCQKLLSKLKRQRLEFSSGVGEQAN